jgi:hypothetical protein
MNPLASQVYPSALKTKAVVSSEILVTVYQNKHLHIKESYAAENQMY